MTPLYRLSDRLRDRARRKRDTPAHATGRRGEDLAHRYLRRQGYTIAARNWRTATGSGEIDIVAWDGATLVFVEVKSRQTAEFGAPETAVDADKRVRLIRAARAYTRRTGAPWDRTRFDVVSVVFSPPGVEHFRDAFSIERPVSRPAGEVSR